MATPVFSTRFLEGRASTGATFTVPAGFRAVVRDVTFFNQQTLTVTSMFVLGATGAVVVFFVDNNPTADVYHQWEGRVVYEAGDIIVASAGHIVDFNVAGYLLTLP